MKQQSYALLVTVALSVLCLPEHALAQSGAASQTSSAQQTGNNIGTIVLSAIQTALPIVGSVMKLFEGNSQTSATKAQIKSASNDESKQFITALKQNIAPAATVVKELEVIQTFATAAVSADESVIRINNLLASAHPDYQQIDTEWTIAKNYMQDVLTVRKTDIQTISNILIQSRLLDIQNSRLDLWVRIDRNIAIAKVSPDQISKADLEAQVSAFDGLLKGVNSIATLELNELEADLGKLVQWASAQQALAPKEFENRGGFAPNERVMQILSDSIASARETIKATPLPAAPRAR